MYLPVFKETPSKGKEFTVHGYLTIFSCRTMKLPREQFCVEI
jgi:hypothetical protein